LTRGTTRQSISRAYSAVPFAFAGWITARSRLLEPVRDNAIYAAHLSSRGKLVDLGAKRVAGDTTIYVFDFNSETRVSASGAMRGRTVTVTAPTRTVGIGIRPAGSPSLPRRPTATHGG
jgi:hypothetical protein